MFRIRQVPGDTTPANTATVHQVQQILRERLPGLDPADSDKLPQTLRDPFRQRFRPLLFVAEDARDRVRGFALLLHAPDLQFCYLDYIASAAGRSGGGIGGALYERVREEAAALGAAGLFFESLPDDPALSPDAAVRRQNVQRLRFYERYGARPIANTEYETPLTPGDDNPPYLVFDGLGRGEPLSRERTRAIVRAILERKYGELCPPEYVRQVVSSFRDDPVVLRAPRYHKGEPLAPLPAAAQRIALVVNDRHDIHHVRERGYVEAPARIQAILRQIEPTGMFERMEPRRYPLSHIRAVHEGRLVSYLRRACAQVGMERSVYPYVFPVRNAARPPKELPLRAGYFCIDTFTPINGNAYPAAVRGVECALTAADAVLGGRRLAYALVRPPGHHAERGAFGGFCYFNNAAVAGHYLSRFGRVAVLDVDYHHGNGTQDIFYDRRDVLTVSLHGHPSFAYPYFSGFAEEEGIGAGAGYNLNLPLPEQLDPEQYRRALARALSRIARFAPDFLVLATGFDTGAGDPTGSWSNRPADFTRIGHLIGGLGVPTVVVQEGGYRVRTLGANARAFFTGLAGAIASPRAEQRRRRRAAPAPAADLEWRDAVRSEDAAAVRALVAATGVFSSEEEAIAEELVRERLERGAESGYEFLLLAQGPHLLGYACFGPIPGTEGRFDLYWLAVDPDRQRDGLGRVLMERVEHRVAELGGRLLFVDTSSRDTYRPARAFYRRCGFRQVAELPDFFRAGDGKVIFSKRLSEG